MENKRFIRWAWATLLVIYLVIIAGSVVRMTGSGMGCPDWPKCFGYLIPPTEEEQVIFQPNAEYFEGQMIIVEDELLRAKQSFTSSSEINLTNWEVYEKHDYAIFNPAHTWTEYINRLFGALSGLFMIVLFGLAIVGAIKNKLSWFVPLLVFIATLLLAFQAWLGKVVVDTHLDATKLTAHMVGALALIAVMLVIVRIAKAKTSKIALGLKPIIAICMGLLLVQFYFGTDFRMVVDEATGNGVAVGNSFQEIFKTIAFKVHRSFAWVLLIAFGYLFYLARKKRVKQSLFSIIFLLLIAEIIVGVAMSYFQFPFLSQPIHLLLATLLFGALFWLLLLPTQQEQI